MEPYTEADLTRFFDVAMKLVDKAGKVVAEAIDNRDKIVSEKLSAADVVTETDKAVEKMLIDGLKTEFPDHQFIGEETTAEKSLTDGVETLTNSPTWMIDPIDGTMNFVHTNPMVCISIGLAINKKLVMGIINAPAIGKLYSAIKGRGAFANGKPIKVSQCKDLSRAQLLMEMWAQPDETTHEILAKNMKKCLENTHSIRCLGSAAICTAFVAAGNSDIHQLCGMHCWDVAAGAIIIHEAGGVVVDPSGGEFDCMSRRILAAANMDLVQQWLKLDIETSPMPRDHPDKCTL